MLLALNMCLSTISKDGRSYTQSFRYFHDSSKKEIFKKIGGFGPGDIYDSYKMKIGAFYSKRLQIQFN